MFSNCSSLVLLRLFIHILKNWHLGTSAWKSSESGLIIHIRFGGLFFDNTTWVWAEHAYLSTEHCPKLLNAKRPRVLLLILPSCYYHIWCSLPFAKFPGTYHENRKFLPHHRLSAFSPWMTDQLGGFLYITFLQAQIKRSRFLPCLVTLVICLQESQVWREPLENEIVKPSLKYTI